MGAGVPGLVPGMGVCVPNVGLSQLPTWGWGSAQRGHMGRWEPGAGSSLALLSEVGSTSPARASETSDRVCRAQLSSPVCSFTPPSLHAFIHLSVHRVALIECLLSTWPRWALDAAENKPFAIPAPADDSPTRLGVTKSDGYTRQG